MLRPLADRVLLEPVWPTPTNSLIVTPENAARDLPTTGTVIAVGEGSRRLQVTVQAALTSLTDSVAHLPRATLADVGCGAVRLSDVLALLERAQRRFDVPSEVEVGQLVIFDPLAAHDLSVDGTDYVTVPEDAVIAQVED